MLWIISMISTVLPTPAPPNRPALPPRSTGASRSIALIPVRNSSSPGRRLASGTGGWRMGRLSTSSSGPRRSIGSPNMLSMRPNRPGPTGNSSAVPRHRTGPPTRSARWGRRTSPRTSPGPRILTTSMIAGASSPVSRTSPICGTPSVRRMSKTLPSMATIWPTLAVASFLASFRGSVMGSYGAAPPFLMLHPRGIARATAQVFPIGAHSTRRCRVLL